MSPLEIALIIIGIITIFISCILVDKNEASAIQPNGKAFSVENSLTEEEIKRIKDKMDEIFTEISEEVIIRTDDALSNLSNEKIMAVSEFSDQILEKIKKNHEEVVFLYSMLNDKEKELKAAVKEIDSSKKKVQDIIESKNIIEKNGAGKEQKSQTAAKPISQAIRNEKPAKAVTTTPSELTQDMQSLTSLNSNSNSQILTLYSRGKSIMEISKLLNLGQGEVKLVIDLFKGKK